MPSAKPLPDVIVGHHPDHGIVATTPTPFAAGRWRLNRLGFRPLPNAPDLFTLDGQERDGPGRATRAVALLRTAGYRVDADIALDPELAPAPSPRPGPPRRIGPDVAFAEHPRLGLVAATTDGVREAHALLDAHGWQHQPRLDIYTLPSSADREHGLAAVAATTVAVYRAGLQAAVHPQLAGDIAGRRRAERSAARRAPDTPSAHRGSAHADAVAGIVPTSAAAPPPLSAEPRATRTR